MRQSGSTFSKRGEGLHRGRVARFTNYAANSVHKVLYIRYLGIRSRLLSTIDQALQLKPRIAHSRPREQTYSSWQQLCSCLPRAVFLTDSTSARRLPSRYLPQLLALCDSGMAICRTKTVAPAASILMPYGVMRSAKYKCTKYHLQE